MRDPNVKPFLFGVLFGAASLFVSFCIFDTFRLNRLTEACDECILEMYKVRNDDGPLCVEYYRMRKEREDRLL